MNAKLGVLVVGFGLLGSFVPALAHHSFAAEYDANKTITVTGTVTKFEWTNPHAHFYVDVKDAKGEVKNFNVEISSPINLKRRGWSRDDLKPGDTVTVEGYLAKDGAQLIDGQKVTLGNGRKLFAGSPTDPGGGKEKE